MRDGDHLACLDQPPPAGTQQRSPWEHSLYEFKSMLGFLSYGAKQIADAFEGKLEQTHQQCRHHLSSS